MTSNPEWMQYAQAAFALLFVICLIFLLKVTLQKTGLDKRLTGSKGTARLDVVDTMYLDARHKLVLVRKDDREHLLLIGGTNELLIESSSAKTPMEGKMP